MKTDIREHDVYCCLDEDETIHISILRQKRIVRVLGFALKVLFILAVLVLTTDVFTAWYSGAFDRLVR